jgi:hypothetical protein
MAIKHPLGKREAWNNGMMSKTPKKKPRQKSMKKKLSS